jgi:hypothetical protein
MTHAPTFMLDGSPHETGNRNCPGCLGAARPCYCGGVVHEQAVYGPSNIHECDACETEGRPTDSVASTTSAPMAFDGRDEYTLSTGREEAQRRAAMTSLAPESPAPDVPAFTLEEIRRAFWLQFHKSGELWFNYLGTPEENEASTRSGWQEFEEALTGKTGEPEGGSE